MPSESVTVMALANAGARFTAMSAGNTTACVSAATVITVTDSLGIVATANYILTAGATARPAATTDLALAPPNISLAADPVSTYCTTSSARYNITGGTAPYLVSTSIPQITATLSDTNRVDVQFASDSKWKMLKGQVASILVLDAAGKVVTATLGCN